MRVSFSIDLTGATSLTNLDKDPLEGKATGFNKPPYNMNSFFAGIGGFDLAFERAGFDVSYICEINDYCNKVLDLHYPHAARGYDINSLVPEDVPAADVWCGGFPCQDISVARGAQDRLGLKGSRSGLFYRFAELVEHSTPRVVLIENVAGLFNSNYGQDLHVVLQTMDRLGYAVAWRLLNSRYFGVPQSRPRVYLCCWRSDPCAAVRCMFEQSPDFPLEGERNGFMEESTPPGLYPRVPKVSYCLAATTGRHTGTDWSRTYATCADGVRRLTPIECERLQGFPDNWTNVATDDDPEAADSLRYAAIGNAVTVPVVEVIAQRIFSELDNSTGQELLTSDFLASFPAFIGRSLIELPDFSELNGNSKIKWPKAGLLYAGSFLPAKANSAPSEPIQCNLFDFMEKQSAHDRYYLSPNAAEGILRRVDSNQRHLFQPLRNALEQLAARKA